MENSKTDPTLNVKELLTNSINRIDDLREFESKRVDDVFKNNDIKYQIQFTAAEKAIAIASTAQEKLTAQALEGTKEAINKADIATDKRFSLLSEKIDGVVESINKNAGAQGIYVTHTDLNNAMDKLQSSIEATLRPVVAFMNSQTGRERATDPQMALLLSEVKILRDIQNTNTGKGAGLNMGWVYLLGGIGALGGIIALVLNALRLTNLGL